MLRVFVDCLLVGPLNVSTVEAIARMACTCKAFASDGEYLKTRVRQEAEALIGTMCDSELHEHVAQQKAYIYKCVDLQWIARAFKSSSVLSDVFFVLERENPALYKSLTPNDMALMGFRGQELMTLLCNTDTLAKTSRTWLEAMFPEGFLEAMARSRVHFPAMSKEWTAAVFPLGLWHYAQQLQLCRDSNWIVWNVLEYCDDDHTIQEWDEMEKDADAMIAAL